MLTTFYKIDGHFQDIFWKFHSSYFQSIWNEQLLLHFWILFLTWIYLTAYWQNYRRERVICLFHCVLVKLNCSFIYSVPKIFRKTSISYPLIRTRACAYQGGKKRLCFGKFCERTEWMNDPQYINPLKHYVQKWPNIF